MRLYWNFLFKTRRYRYATITQRRILEIRFSLAKTLRRARRQAHLTQAQLAAKIGTSQPTISRMERGTLRVTIDVFLNALIALECDDDAIAAAFNPGLRSDIQMLRQRVARGYTRPRLTSERFEESDGRAGHPR